MTALIVTVLLAVRHFFRRLLVVQERKIDGHNRHYQAHAATKPKHR